VVIVTRIVGADLTARFRQRVHRRPDMPLIWEDGRSATGRSVLELVEAKIVGYRDAGVDENARVGVLGRSGLDFVTDLFAVFGLGGAVAPLPKSTSEWELRRYAELTRLTHLVVPTGSPLGLGGSVTDVAGRRLSRSPLRSAVDNHGASAVQLTSGTTGWQRAALRSAAALVAEAEAYERAFGLTEREVIGCTVPLHHAYGFGLCALAAPLAGTPVHFLSSDRPRVLLRDLQAHGVTLFPSVPPMLRLLGDTASAGDVSFPMRCVTAGMPLDARGAEAVGRVFGGLLGQVYGTTETGPICVQAPQDWRHVLDGLGPALPGVEIELLPDEGEDAETGLVAVRSPSMMDGYLSDAGPDRTPLRAGRFVTGDLARWNPGGLGLVGRLSNCINVAGAKVSPEEIESVLMEFPGVRSVLVVGVEDDRIGQRVKTTVAPETVDLEELKRFCRQRLSPPRLPHLYEAVADLPTTETGKVLRPANRG
jgi:acyl-CoA synthetase (AMP-forming)/AMP-acid ligase II